MKALLWCALLLLPCMGIMAASVAAQPESRQGEGIVSLPIDGAHDVTGEGHAFVELVTPRSMYFVQEQIRLRLRFGFDERFLKTSMIQLFRRRLDIPVQVQAPWLMKLPGARARGEAPDRGGPDRGGPDGGSGKRQSFALNDRVVAAAPVAGRVIGGRRFTVLEVEKRYLPERSGELVVPAPILRFAAATRFNEDFVKGRVAVDRRDVFVRGKRLTLRIRPLPTAGRPAEFTGAVGRFSIRAEANPRDPTVGGSLKLVLRIEGEGNLEALDPPRLDELDGFHVFGKVDDRSKNTTHRTVTYDLAPLSTAVKAVPPIRFAFFDPTPPAGYRTVQTRRIPLTVGPLPAGARRDLLAAGKTGRLVPGVNDIFDIKTPAAEPRAAVPLAPSPVLRWTVLLLPWLLVLLLWLWLRGRTQAEPHAVRARGAAAAFRTRVGRPDTDIGDTDIGEAFAEFLAAHLDCSVAAVIAPDIGTRLEAAGLSKELAARATALLESQVAARYDGAAATDGTPADGTPADDGEAVHALVEALDASFRKSPQEPIGLRQRPYPRMEQG